MSDVCFVSLIKYSYWFRLIWQALGYRGQQNLYVVHGYCIDIPVHTFSNLKLNDDNLFACLCGVHDHD